MELFEAGPVTPDEWLDARVFVGGCHYKGPDRSPVVRFTVTVADSPRPDLVQQAVNFAAALVARNIPQLWRSTL